MFHRRCKYIQREWHSCAHLCCAEDPLEVVGISFMFIGVRLGAIILFPIVLTLLILCQCLWVITCI